MDQFSLKGGAQETVQEAERDDKTQLLLVIAERDEPPPYMEYYARSSERILACERNRYS